MNKKHISVMPVTSRRHRQYDNTGRTCVHTDVQVYRYTGIQVGLYKTQT